MIVAAMKFPIHECVIIRGLAHLAWLLSFALMQFGHHIVFLREIGNFAEGFIFGLVTGLVLWVWSWISGWKAVKLKHYQAVQVFWLFAALVVESGAILLLLTANFQF